MLEYTDSFGITDKIYLDLSLARGLDYYTGVIYEAVLSENQMEMGSIAAGGRYDDLIGKLGGENVAAVGFSVGIERIFSIQENQAKERKVVLRTNETDVLVASIDKDLLKERMKIANTLWANNIKAEFLPKKNPKLQPQLSYALESQIPFVIIIGRNEIEKNEVLLKDLDKKTQDSLPRDSFVGEVARRIGLRDQIR